MRTFQNSAKVVALVLACAVAGCMSRGNGNGSGPGTSPTEQIRQDGRGPVRVTRVRVFMREGVPQAFVEGEIGDGCSRLDSVAQERTANTVVITATLLRQGQQCTMIMQYLNRWVPLGGSFAPGEYLVRANSAEVAFRLVASGEGTLRVEPDPGALPQ
jgi:hypothetical protein